MSKRSYHGATSRSQIGVKARVTTLTMELRLAPKYVLSPEFIQDFVAYL